MIKPDKYLNINISVINISANILKILIKKEIITYDELLMNLINKISSKVRELYIPSLSFLFLLDLIEYHDKLDSFTLKK